MCSERQARIVRLPLKPALIAALLIFGIVPTARAEDVKPPLLIVRPSGVDGKTDDARAREDRLYRRMQENDYLFRNICVRCGGGINRLGSNAPFNPIKTLSPSQRQGLDSDDSDSAQ
jgi:hypothetical protein